MAAVLVSGDSLRRRRPVQGPRLRPRFLARPQARRPATDSATRRPARRSRPTQLGPLQAQVCPLNPLSGFEPFAVFVSGDSLWRCRSEPFAVFVSGDSLWRCRPVQGPRL